MASTLWLCEVPAGMGFGARRRVYRAMHVPGLYACAPARLRGRLLWSQYLMAWGWGGGGPMRKQPLAAVIGGGGERSGTGCDGWSARQG